MKIAENKPELLDVAILQIENGQETIESFLEAHPSQAEQLRPELEAALWLRRGQQAVSARPGFIASSQTHLVELIRTKQLRHRRPRLSHRPAVAAPRNRLLEGLSLALLLLCVIFVSHNVVLMSELSLPGEPLYPVKLILEQAQLAFNFDPKDDARLQLQLSQRRTTEIIELILSENYAAVPQAAKRLERQLASCLAALRAIERVNPAESRSLTLAYQETLSTETMILSILMDTYPSDARDFIAIALQVTSHGLAALQD